MSKPIIESSLDLGRHAAVMASGDVIKLEGGKAFLVVGPLQPEPGTVTTMMAAGRSVTLTLDPVETCSFVEALLRRCPEAARLVATRAAMEWQEPLS